MRPDTAAYRSATRRSIVALAVIAVVSITAGFALYGADGAWTAVAGVAVAAVFSLTTQVAAWRGSIDGPTAFVGWVAGTWLVKILVVIAATVAAQYQDWLIRPLFGLVMLTGALTALVIEILAVVRARIPYASPDSRAGGNGVG